MLQAAFSELLVARRFHVSNAIAILGVCLFVGLVFLVACSLSDIYGRNAIYRVGIKYCGRVIGRRAGRLISVCEHQSGQLEKDWEKLENPEKVQVVSEDGSRY